MSFERCGLSWLSAFAASVCVANAAPEVKWEWGSHFKNKSNKNLIQRDVSEGGKSEWVIRMRTSLWVPQRMMYWQIEKFVNEIRLIHFSGKSCQFSICTDPHSCETSNIISLGSYLFSSLSSTRRVWVVWKDVCTYLLYFSRLGCLKWQWELRWLKEHLESIWSPVDHESMSSPILRPEYPTPTQSQHKHTHMCTVSEWIYISRGEGSVHLLLLFDRHVHKRERVPSQRLPAQFHSDPQVTNWKLVELLIIGIQWEDECQSTAQQRENNHNTLHISRSFVTIHSDWYHFILFLFSLLLYSVNNSNKETGSKLKLFVLLVLREAKCWQQFVYRHDH